MSQDLFAAFGDVGPVKHDRAHDVVLNKQPVQTQQEPMLSSRIDDEDDFGDFEDANIVQPQTTIPNIAQPQITIPDKRLSADWQQPSTDKTNGTRKETRPVNGQTAHPGKLPFKLQTAASTAKKDSRIGRHPFADHMDVLFDADNDEYDAGQDEWNDLSNNPEAAMAYSKRVIQEQLDAEAAAKAGAQSYPTITAVQEQATSPGLPTKPKDLNVLFDAEDLSEDEAHVSDGNGNDDWGDFEDPGLPKGSMLVGQASYDVESSKTRTTDASLDLLGLDDALPDVLPMVSRTTITTAAPTKKTVQVADSTRQICTVPAQDDPWDDFESVQQPRSAIVPVAVGIPQSKAIISLQPPTNIPPPSVLLSFLGVLLRTNAQPDTVTELLISSWVLAHILAGRKLRWKRSPTLAASMRIGPAVAGGKSGMKLAGIDRAEVAKEDREVAEVLSIWRVQVGKLRTAVATFNAIAGSRVATFVKKTPDISEAMPVKTLKAMEGGFIAPHECALCGLKRDERVVKVDEDVQDSFGEWWIDQAHMHAICADWWTRNEQSLRSR